MMRMIILLKKRVSTILTAIDEGCSWTGYDELFSDLRKRVS